MQYAYCIKMTGSYYRIFTTELKKKNWSGGAVKQARKILTNKKHTSFKHSPSLKTTQHNTKQ